MPARELYPYQVESVKWLRARRFGILGHVPGLGKTPIAVMAANLPCLVVCPAGLVLNWRREIALWRPADASGFHVVSYNDASLPVAHHVAPWATIIVDEAHYIKNPAAKRTRLVCRLLRAIGDKGSAFALSGTPIPNRPIEIWPLLYTMRLTPLSYVKFAYRYAGAWLDGSRGLNVSGASNVEELRELLAPHVFRYTKAQVLPDLPPITWRVLALDLSADRAEKAFNIEHLKRLPAPVAFEAFADVLHMQGLTKVPAVLRHVTDLLDGGGIGKLILFAHHRDVIDALADGLSDFDPVTLHGGHTRHRRQAAVDAFQDPESDVRVFIGQIQAAGVGYTLTASNYVVFAESSWVGATMQQAADRAHRVGTLSAVNVDVLTRDRSVDEYMLNRALVKQGVVDQLIRPTNYSLDTSRAERVHTDSTHAATAANPTKGHQMTEGNCRKAAELYTALSAVFSDMAEGIEEVVGDPSQGTTAAPKATRSKKKTAKKKDSAKKTRRRRMKPDADAAAENEANPSNTHEDVQGLMQRIVAEFEDGNEILREEFEKAGVKTLSKIPAAKLDEFYDTLAAILKEDGEDD